METPIWGYGQLLRSAAPLPLAMNRRFAIIQALVSLVALAAVVWWASRQDSPHIPTDGGAIAWLLAAVGLYAAASLVRGERWHRILELTGVHARRVDCYALTCVGYMGNNVLPARAGEALRVVLLTDHPLVVTGIGVVLALIAAAAIWVLRAHHIFERARDWLRPLADAPRALLGREGVVLLAGTFVVWAFEGAVYLAVAHSLDLDFSVTGALYLVAL